jgi:hypothetical protein
MAIDIAGEVSALVQETVRVERESEKLYLELGRLFPQLSSEMEKSAEAAEQSIRHLGELESMGRAVDVRALVEEAKEFFQSLYARDSSFLAKVTEGIERLSSLDQIIAKVRADSEEMEIISLNAMTFALKSGAAGKAFSVITDELKRISGTTIALSEGVTASGRILLESFARLRASLSEMDEFQRGFFHSLYESIGKHYDEIESGLSAASAFFASLLAEAHRVREPVLAVMGEIQLQDIVRQSLQHVGISLTEARSAAESGEDRAPAFIAAVAELSEDLVSDIARKIGASADAFGTDMDAIRDLVAACDRRRADFFSNGEKTFTTIDSDSFTKGSARYLELKRGVLSMASSLAYQVKGLDDSFKGLAALLTRFQNIVVASRIEVAKTRALDGVATTVRGMVELTGRIEADVEAAMGMTKEFIKLSQSAVGAFASSEAADGARLVSVLEELGLEIKTLQGRRDTIHSAVLSFELYTPGFISLVERARGDVASLRALEEGLGAVGASLRFLEDSLRAGMGPGESEPEPERMRRMVERFTIFTHKKAAADIGNFDVEAGTESGEVTLF